MKLKTLAIALALLCTGCTSMAYMKEYPDGTEFSVWVCEVGTDKTLDGFMFETDGRGTIKSSLNSLNTEQSKAAGAVTSATLKALGL